PTGRRLFDQFLVSAPVIGPVMRTAYVSRVSFSLNSMLTCGCDLLTTLKLTARSLTNSCFANSLSNVHERVTKGASLAQAFQLEPLYPSVFATFVAVGEESATLDWMLSKVTRLLDEQLQIQLDTYATLVEPLMIALMGGLVAAIMLLFFLPMMQLV